MCSLDIFGVCDPAIPPEVIAALNSLKRDIFSLRNTLTTLEQCTQSPRGCDATLIESFKSQSKIDLHSACKHMQVVTCKMPHDSDVHCEDAPSCGARTTTQFLLSIPITSPSTFKPSRVTVSSRWPSKLETPHWKRKFDDIHKRLTLASFYLVALFALSLIASLVQFAGKKQNAPRDVALRYLVQHKKPVVGVALSGPLWSLLFSMGIFVFVWVHMFLNTKVEILFAVAVDKITRVHTTLAISGCSGDDGEVDASLHAILTQVSAFDVHVFWLCICSALPLASWICRRAAKRLNRALGSFQIRPRETDTNGLGDVLISSNTGTIPFSQPQDVGNNLLGLREYGNDRRFRRQFPPHPQFLVTG